MAVASHLGIAIAEYDSRIRTFIPRYREMLRTAASALTMCRRDIGLVVDLGMGSGALTAQALRVATVAACIGIDEDHRMLDLAHRRLRGDRAAFVCGDFTRVAVPRCDAIISSFALHHVRTIRQKRVLDGRLFRSISPGGMLINADCCPATAPALRDRDRLAWRAHLERSYSRRQSDSFLLSWAREDHYVPLEQELSMMRAAGFVTDVMWRRDAFAVVAGYRP